MLTEMKSNMLTEQNAISERFRHYSQRHAIRGSALYSLLSAHVTESPQLLALLASVPASKARPQLLFAAYRQLFGMPDSWEDFRRNICSRASEVRKFLTESHIQVNEPSRCTSLLPALAQFSGPLALIEVGCSAGLCMLLDSYEYWYGDDFIPALPVAGLKAPQFRCQVTGTLSSGNTPEIAWRRGIDLDPIDLSDESQVAWLESFVWPGPRHAERLEHLRTAIAIAREVRPEILQGNLATDLAAVIRQVPLGLTIVVVNMAVLTYTTPAERRAYVTQLSRSRAHWVNVEPPHVFPRIAKAYGETLPDSCLLISLDRQPVGLADLLGMELHWRPAAG
jgi:hypothetical protein